MESCCDLSLLFIKVVWLPAHLCTCTQELDDPFYYTTGGLSGAMHVTTPNMLTLR